jgi:ABC-type methionine transport system permease subunit
LAANATPSWAPRKAGRAALTTAIAAASVTMVSLRAVVGAGGSGGVGRRSGGRGVLEDLSRFQIALGVIRTLLVFTW